MKIILLLALQLASLPAFAAQENVLRLFFMPTYPARLNWASPKAMIESAINGMIRNRSHAIGHVNIELSCGESADASLLTGATGSGMGPISKMLLMEKVGLSILERGWLGEVESRDRVLHSFAVRGQDPNQLSIVTFEISSEACQRLKSYYSEYTEKTKPIYYGFTPRPRYKEGAGCSAFGASFVELAGLLSPKIRAAWAQEKRIPLGLMAGHLGQAEVPISVVRESPLGLRWALPEEPNFLLEFYDPDLMYEWAKQLAASPSELSAMGGKLDTDLPHGIHGVPAIRLDRRDVPVPSDPIFLGEPRLKQVTETSVIRTDFEFSPNGSFELRP